MADYTITIPGLKEMAAQFAKIGEDLPAAFDRAMVASVTEVKQEAQSKVPVKTGQLKQSIDATVSHNPLIGQIVVGQPYGVYVEYGTKAHEIRPKNAQALYWKGAPYPVKVVHHPGTKANPFLENAMNSKQSTVMDYFRRAMQTVLDNIAKASK